MAKRKVARRTASPAEVTPSTARAAPLRSSDDAERTLGRVVGFALPLATVVVALGVGVVTSIGPALLVLASGVLLGAIALFWSSLRTLSGDAPLPAGFSALAAQRRAAVDAADERKRTLLRALKDIEHEHAIGKLDDADYRELSESYREQAKAVMREIDERLRPLYERAERMAQSYLRQRGLAEDAPPPAGADAPPAAAPTDASAASPPAAPSSRTTCAACGASNEPDAAFCKKCGIPLEPESEDNAST
jgi:hypothetical protein